MKKLLVVLGCVSLLSACETLFYESDENALAQRKDIIWTLDVYDINCSTPINNLYLTYLSEDKEAVCCHYFDKDSYPNPRVYEDCGMSEDKCKIYKRNNPQQSEICFFNYKKYLPENVADNEQEFLVLHNKFQETFTHIYGYGAKASACEYNDDLTQMEKQQCNEKAKNDFVSWALAGGAKKQINHRMQVAQKAEQKKKEQQAINKERHEEQLADCKQAKEKVAVRLKQIKTALGLNVNEKNIQYSLEGKVVDFTNEGIMISSDCSGIWANGWILGDIGVMAAANCTEERWFIYTKNTDYATGEKFSNKGRLYKKAGNYKYTTITGSINSVPAFRETPYMFSEVNYKTYLKDKSIQKCD